MVFSIRKSCDISKKLSSQQQQQQQQQQLQQHESDHRFREHSQFFFRSLDLLFFVCCVCNCI
jgi:hypothetical protein